MASPSSPSSQQQQQQQPPPEPQAAATTTTTTTTAAQTAPQPPQPVHTPAGFQPLVYNARNVIPYAPFQFPQQAFEAPEPEPSRPWELTKTALHALSVVLGATGIGLGFSTLKYEYFYATVLISAIPPCMIALVWSLADLLVRLLRRLKAGIHPGAHIALSLIIFLLGAILPSLFGPWFGDSWNASGDRPYESCSSVYDPVSRSYDYTCTVDAAARRQYLRERRVATAAAVVTYIVAVLHFGLFVGACVDTEKVNRLAKRPIYVVAPPPQMMQWQPMPQQYQVPMQQAPMQQAPMQQAPMQQVPMQQAPVQQAPVQPPPAQETPPTEAESQTRDKGKGKATDVGKGKEPMRNPIVEYDAPSSSQA